MRYGSVTTMPFGKYAGWLIDDVPPDYLRWCLRNLTRLGPGLRAAMADALGVEDDGPDDDDGYGRDDPPERPSGGSVVALIERVCRSATLRFHPDRGGSNDAMQAVNHLRDALLSAARDEFGSN